MSSLESNESKKDYTAFSSQDWRNKLSDEQYRVTRESGTEAPFRNAFWDHKETGTYHCICCETPLFASNDKFDSGSGWPSFTKPLESHNIANKKDHKLSTVRTEVLCKNCDAHLGHVFDDGPPPTKKRYCINSAALFFVAESTNPSD